MNWWNRSKMSEQENENSNDTEGVRVTEFEEMTENNEVKEAKAPEVIALETELKTERERRDAAEKKLIEVQARFDQIKISLERETAEMRERMRKSLEERAKQGQFNFLTALLPVLDNLNLAIKAAENEIVSEGLMSGVRGTASGFEAALVNVGVEIVPAVGAKFDPEIHEAVDVVEAAEDNIITKEYSRGYKLGERLLRPARVQVGHAAANADAAAE